jgi:hypothetical protein
MHTSKGEKFSDLRREKLKMPYYWVINEHGEFASSLHEKNEEKELKLYVVPFSLKSLCARKLGLNLTQHSWKKITECAPLDLHEYILRHTPFIRQLKVVGIAKIYSKHHWKKRKGQLTGAYLIQRATVLDNTNSNIKIYKKKILFEKFSNNKSYKTKSYCYYENGKKHGEESQYVGKKYCKRRHFNYGVCSLMIKYEKYGPVHIQYQTKIQDIEQWNEIYFLQYYSVGKYMLRSMHIHHNSYSSGIYFNELNELKSTEEDERTAIDAISEWAPMERFFILNDGKGIEYHKNLNASLENNCILSNVYIWEDCHGGGRSQKISVETFKTEDDKVVTTVEMGDNFYRIKGGFVCTRDYTQICNPEVRIKTIEELQLPNLELKIKGKNYVLGIS